MSILLSALKLFSTATVGFNVYQSINYFIYALFIYTGRFYCFIRFIFYGLSYLLSIIYLHALSYFHGLGDTGVSSRPD